MPKVNSWMNSKPPNRKLSILEAIKQATRANENGSILKIRVQPGAKTNQLAIRDGVGLTVKIRAPAKDGKANSALRRYIARDLLKISQSKVHIAIGTKSREKHLEIELDLEELRTRIHSRLQQKNKL